MAPNATQAAPSGKGEAQPRRLPSPATITATKGSPDMTGTSARSQGLAILAAILRSRISSGEARKTPKVTEATAPEITAMNIHPFRQARVPAERNTEVAVTMKNTRKRIISRVLMMASSTSSKRPLTGPGSSSIFLAFSSDDLVRARQFHVGEGLRPTERYAVPVRQGTGRAHGIASGRACAR